MTQTTQNSLENQLADKMGWEYFPVRPYFKWFKAKYPGQQCGTPTVRSTDIWDAQQVWCLCDHCKHPFSSGELRVCVGHVLVCPDVGDSCLFREAVRTP